MQPRSQRIILPNDITNYVTAMNKAEACFEEKKYQDAAQYCIWAFTFRPIRRVHYGTIEDIFLGCYKEDKKSISFEMLLQLAEADAPARYKVARSAIVELIDSEEKLKEILA